jgi:hypothetical protein
LDLSWFRPDPFFIFGFLMQLAIVGYGVYLLIKVRTWRKMRRLVKDGEALAWAKAINNPNCPTRPTKEYAMGSFW